MLAMFGIKDYVIAGLVAVILMCGTYYKIVVSELKTEVSELTGTIRIKMAEIEIQNAAIISMAADFEQKSKEAQVVKTEIHTRYKVIYQTVDNFVKDDNATDCDNLRKFASSINW